MFKLKNSTYDFLKWFALVAIPATCTLVLTVGKIWGLPQYDNIGATISAIGLFIAALIGASTSAYYGEIDPNLGMVDENFEDYAESEEEDE